MNDVLARRMVSHMLVMLARLMVFHVLVLINWLVLHMEIIEMATDLSVLDFYSAAGICFPPPIQFAKFCVCFYVPCAIPFHVCAQLPV